MNNGWIKLYRKTIDNGILRDGTAWQVFSWILLRVDRNGKMISGRFWASQDLDIKPTTYYKAIKRLEKKWKVVTLSSNNKNTIIEVNNWTKHQDGNTSSDNKVTTEGQQSNTIQESKKEESKKEEKGPLENSINYLLEFPYEDFDDIDASRRLLRIEGEKAYNWVQSKGKKYKNYKAFMRNWVLKNYKKKLKEVKVVYEDYEVDPNGLAKIREMKQKLLKSNSFN